MRFNDAVFGVLVLALAVYIFFTARAFPTSAGVAYGPGFFPMLLSVILAGCGLLLCVRGLRSLPASGWLRLTPELRQARSWLGFGLVLLALVGYSALDDFLGFHITALLVVLGFMLFLGVQPLRALIIAAIAVAVTYIIFARILLVPLPAGLLSRILW